MIASPSDALAHRKHVCGVCFALQDEEVIKASQKSTPAEDEGGEEAQLGEEEWPDVIGEAGDLPM